MSANPDLSLPDLLIQQAATDALREDLGRAGDITSNAIVGNDEAGSAVIRSRDNGVIAGLPLAEAAFKILDPNTGFKAVIEDGCEVKGGSEVAAIEGRARVLLAGERVALNFLSHLSGIATETRRYVQAVAGTNARITCTRKTTPGLRALEKYAVRAGGGYNHRFGLDDAILIKDNHIALAGGIGPAIERSLANKGHMVRIEVEVDTIDQLELALGYPIDAVLLDNMVTETLQEAVRLADGRVTTEASGGVSIDTVRAIAGTGVDYISCGALTHSAPSLDIGLDICAPPS